MQKTLTKSGKRDSITEWYWGDELVFSKDEAEGVADDTYASHIMVKIADHIEKSNYSIAMQTYIFILFSDLLKNLFILSLINTIACQNNCLTIRLKKESGITLFIVPYGKTSSIAIKYHYISNGVKNTKEYMIVNNLVYDSDMLESLCKKMVILSMINHKQAAEWATKMNTNDMTIKKSLKKPLYK